MGDINQATERVVSQMIVKGNSSSWPRKVSNSTKIKIRKEEKWNQTKVLIPSSISTGEKTWQLTRARRGTHTKAKLRVGDNQAVQHVLGLQVRKACHGPSNYNSTQSFVNYQQLHPDHVKLVLVDLLCRCASVALNMGEFNISVSMTGC